MEHAGIAIGGSDEETVVDVALLGCRTHFGIERLDRSGRRIGVGHVEIGGDATGSGSSRLGVDVGTVGHSWFAKVYVGIDDAGQHIAPCGVDDFVEGTLRAGIASFDDFHDVAVVDDDGAVERAAFIDDGSSLNQRSHRPASSGAHWSAAPAAAAPAMTCRRAAPSHRRASWQYRAW